VCRIGSGVRVSADFKFCFKNVATLHVGYVVGGCLGGNLRGDVFKEVSHLLESHGSNRDEDIVLCTASYTMCQFSKPRITTG